VWTDVCQICFLLSSYFPCNPGQWDGRFGGSIYRRNERFFSFSETFRLTSGRPSQLIVCTECWCCEGKAAMAWSWPLTSSHGLGIEWVELYLSCSILLRGLHSHNFSFSPHTTTFSTVVTYDEVFPWRLVHTLVRYLQHCVTFPFELTILKPDTCKP
jgi:hypothetical protein